MDEIRLDGPPGEAAATACDAARGKVIYLTEHGQRLAAIVPAYLAAELENLSPDEIRELLEDFADAQATRAALAEIEAGPARCRTQDQRAISHGESGSVTVTRGRIDRQVSGPGWDDRSAGLGSHSG